MRCIEIRRRHGLYGVTGVIVTTADGEEGFFMAGRHIGSRRIYELAEMMKLGETEE